LLHIHKVGNYDLKDTWSYAAKYSDGRAYKSQRRLKTWNDINFSLKIISLNRTLMYCIKYNSKL